MKKSIIALALLAALTGCLKQAESSAAGVEYRLDELFTRDGCTVYRLSYRGWVGYFPKCEGTTTSHMGWREPCGNSCTRPVDVPTSYALKD